ncbi:hypothetical protein [Microbacterium sp. 22242]|uniref:hypothetical protein n=1 Tax=Microbacterium sp. 22242 TaxID=3453896 RepID=UPI003F87671D
MSQNQLLLWVLLLIAVTALVVWIVRFLQSRRGGGSARDRGAWWEGPWDEDDDPPRDR